MGGGGNSSSGTLDVSAGILNASASTLTIADSYNNGQPVAGLFNMGRGTLNATTIVVGADYGGTGAATGTLNLTAAGGSGLIETQTLTLADRTGSGNARPAPSTSPVARFWRM